VRKLIFVLSTFVATGSATASDKTDAVGVVHQFIDAFNKGDTKASAAVCAAQISIVDEFAPFAWQGPTAFTDWSNDFDADAKKNGITDPVVTLGQTRHVEVTGDRAYVVVAATYAYKKKGKPVTEANARFVVSLQKVAAGWRVTGWA
jgi:ketosteroid isomerase-like protein